MTDISKLADDIINLINSKPRSPLKSEIEAVLQAGIPMIGVFTDASTTGGIIWTGTTTVTTGRSGGSVSTFDPDYHVSQLQLEQAWIEGIARLRREENEKTVAALSDEDLDKLLNATD